MKPTPTSNGQTAQQIADAKRERGRYLAALRRLSSNPDWQLVYSKLRTAAGLPSATSTGAPCFVPGPGGACCPYAAAVRSGRQSILFELESHLAQAAHLQDDPVTGEPIDDREETGE